MQDRCERLLKRLEEEQAQLDDIFNLLMKDHVTGDDPVAEPITSNAAIALQSVYVAKVALGAVVRDMKSAARKAASQLLGV